MGLELLLGRGEVEDVAAGGEEDVRQRRQSATAALTSAKNATREFRTQLERLGTPPTPNGSQAQQAVQSYAGQLRIDAQTLKGEFQQSASSASELKQKAQSIRLTLESALMTLQRAYTQLTQAVGTSELGNALKTSPECKATFKS